MIGKKVLETEPVTMAEVKVILEKFAEEHEFTYEQNLALEHVKKFSKIDHENALKLIEELTELPNIKKKHAVRLADFMPEDIADIRLIFAKERIPIKNEDFKNILKIIEKYR
ncbi:MAG TPA: RNA polymerase Rpb4 family protein [Methanothermobacter sp.]|nr:predicted DNA-directed RNA polymerase, subunit F [Methanothermobacter sp. MT-2]HHW04783.1 DNA-directed RNA polymerase subunit F [Methanothermobacter sp.]HOK72206.1 RNA polymerase Rpb4 family protein [Methanothermobacter sp.]HOL68519.1 RNA polymerase Rpb4 family protein [Methanothermobacter sp.]HPQ04278.1 RNA polymerase Rpb4 family protein [Methanothermobacter sp.]